jgi:hypothetical protein
MPVLFGCGKKSSRNRTGIFGWIPICHPRCPCTWNEKSVPALRMHKTAASVFVGISLPLSNLRDSHVAVLNRDVDSTGIVSKFRPQ